MNTKENSKFLAEVKNDVKAAESIRRHKETPQDVSLAEIVKEKHQVSLAEYLKDMGIEPHVDTIQNLVNMPDEGYRWLIPEIYREALRLGIRRTSMYSALIAGEQGVSQTSVTMPAINMSDATPRKVGVAETIALGEVSFQDKTVKIHKIGRGIKVPYEVSQYVALDILSIYLQDFGVKLGMGIDSLAITTAVNGDQTNGSDSAAVIGIKTPNDLVFKDLLKVWARGARLGKMYNRMIAGEDMGVDVLDMITTTRVFGEQRANVSVKTPMPQSSDMYIHGQIGANQMLIVDPTSAMIKLNAQPLLVETDKIVSNQVNETYATITTGFATIFRDARLILDQTKDIAGNGAFPAWMDPSPYEVVTFQ